MKKSRKKQRKLLALSSGGGHWIQLFRMRPAWDGWQVTYASAMRGLGEEIRQDAAARGQGPVSYVYLPDANRWQKFRMLWSLCRIAWLILILRPDAIITTGAAPGYFAIRVGKLLGVRTIWIDSIANVEELSKAGTLAKRHADLCLTQWEHLAEPGGPDFQGAVL